MKDGSSPGILGREDKQAPDGLVTICSLINQRIKVSVGLGVVYGSVHSENLFCWVSPPASRIEEGRITTSSRPGRQKQASVSFGGLVGY